MSTLSAGIVGVRQAGSSSNSPVYDTPFGTVQLASSSKDLSANFDLTAGFAASADYENQEDEDDEEGDDDDGDSEDGKGKGKKGKRARSEAKGERDLKTGRRKIKIEFIEDDARRHITFSKRKAGIMKKAYELATLTGTQVLLLVVSQTGLVYTFTTPKLQALVTQAEGRNLIQACLNAPDPPNGGGESGGEDHSGDEPSEADDAFSPSESQASSNKRAVQPRKRPRTASTSKSSSASTSVAGAAPGIGGGEEDATSGSQLATVKRGRGRPRKNTAGNAPASSSNTSNDAHPMPPPPAMHQSFSDDAVHQHHQHQHHQHQHRQQQQQQQQYTHVPSADFPNYTAAGFYGDVPNSAANPDLGFGQAGGLSIDNQAVWAQTMSPNPNQMFDPSNHHQHHQQQQQPGQQQSSQQQSQQQQQQQSSVQFGYATQHFGHFNPQQLAAMQPQEIQAPRPAW
ncbi:MADS-box-containing transcription factor [Mycosarcoma maydis]|uniref:MADS-box homolog Umc1 n=1 Tax=Mycosarcoma maydis TaxID=5270 RepID=O42725_MYCMD|nr:MADS-box-containing transcription factor [Ustilago maydis 521]AAB92597.1 MADS-box homolog Umc1 [Ustilago maydis]KIS71324.1 MADS-box-containing transcription factor [Ustilago maydis 521]|eukprot:XP_011387159.1 MADS-box-containing transcription factor [Ustilago maydis 521]